MRGLIIYIIINYIALISEYTVYTVFQIYFIREIILSYLHSVQCFECDDSCRLSTALATDIVSRGVVFWI